MSHCDYDTIFYRVFCVTVLGIAFTFTVILTNVFIDIDGLLSNKDGAVESKLNYDNYRTEDIKNDLQYDDPSEDAFSYRSKRSLEPDNFLFQVKNPNIKKMLTNKLANLLEELDEEESTKGNVNVAQRKSETENIINKDEKDTERDNDNMLHLAMHNILLQGIIGHMDLNNVYKKVHLLVKNFYEHNTTEKPNDALETSKELQEYPKQNEEQKFFEELLKCKTLKEQVNNIKNYSQQINKQKEPKLVIKTIIEINDKGKQRDNNTNNNDILGLIKLIYNGKSIKIEKLEDTYIKSSKDETQISTTNEQKPNKDSIIPYDTPIIEEKQLSDPKWNKIIENYLKRYPVTNNFDNDIENKRKRQKRQIKFHYLDKKHANNKPKTAQKIKKDDEELYIEIETHFDGKGIKGEKKKKLVRNLINKIQNAIHDDGQAATNKKTMSNHIKVKKRNQDPIKQKHNFFLNKIVPAIRNIEHRQLDPISSLYSRIDNNLNNLKLESPALSGKPISADDMGNLIANYYNEISKREQKPINIESKEFRNHVDDTNNVTFYLKDIDGSGFSVGFNQYIDEPPDVDSLKLFNGVENLIQEYHKTYDDSNKVDKVYENINSEKYIEREQESISNSHVFRRSVNNDPNFKYTYKKLIKNLIKPLTYYKPWKLSLKSKSNRTFSRKDSQSRDSADTINFISKPIKINDLSIAYVNNYYNELPKKDMVDSLEAVLTRQKRSVSVKKISNLNSKIKLNKFVNVNPKFNKKIFKSNKRNKRQVNKIRIIARERSHGKNSNEDNVFLVSPNDLYSKKKGKLREMDASDTQNGDTVPFSEFLNLNYPNQPLMDAYHNEPETLSLPQYPHIFFEEPMSKEYSKDDNSAKPYRIQAKSNDIQQLNNQPNELITERAASAFSNVKLPGVEEIVNAILRPKSNYKVTVKISPKNISDIHSGFKEVHTSVNKSFDRNGIRYFSLLNVSQFSKVENVNDSNRVPEIRRNLSLGPVNKVLKEKERQIQTLFQLHKKRLDSQLDNLKMERSFIENVLHKKEINEDINDEIIENLKEPDDLMTVLRKIDKPSTTTPKTCYTVTKSSQTTERRQPNETVNTILINTLKNNQQTTKEILTKIDANTDLLRQFLNRLTTLQKISPTTEHFDRVYEENIYYHQQTDSRNTSQNNPFPLPQLNYAGMAKPILSTQKPDFRIIKNQSRFFLDDLEDYNAVSATIRINTTQL